MTTNFNPAAAARPPSLPTSPEKRPGSKLSSPEKKARTSDPGSTHTTPRRLNFDESDDPSVTEVFNRACKLDDSDTEPPALFTPGIICFDADSLIREAEAASRKLTKPKRKKSVVFALAKVAQAISRGDFKALHKQLSLAPQDCDPFALLESAKTEADEEDYKLHDELRETTQAMLATLNEKPEHKLSSMAILKLQVAALERLSENNEPAYFHKGGPECRRAMTVDPIADVPRFFVHSKKAGYLQKEGGYKVITNTLLVSPDTKQANQSGYVRVTNQSGEDVEVEQAEEEVTKMRKELAIARLFYKNDIILVSEYENADGKAKIEWIEERYDTDLKPFLEFGRKPNAPKLAPQLLVQILLTVGLKLQEMHTQSFIHNDVNGTNILLKRLADGSYKIKLSDFGAAYNLNDEKYPREDSSGYGTSANTSPEHFGSIPKLEDPTEQGMSDDMYALGCMIYVLIYGVEIPWARVVRMAVDERKPTPALPARLREAFERQLSEYAKIRADAERCTDPFMQRLFHLALGLLNPNPRMRMPLATFLNNLS